jgi:hypothetical protein
MPYQVGVAGQQNLTHLVVVAHCVLCFETAIQTWNVLVVVDMIIETLVERRGLKSGSALRRPLPRGLAPVL